MALKHTAVGPALDFEAEFVLLDPHREHFESLGGQFPKHGIQMRKGILRMLWNTFGRYVSHARYKGVLDYEGSFSSKWLRKHIRDKDYLSVVDPYFERSTNHSFQKKETRRWVLNKEIDNILVKIFSSDVPAVFTFKELPLVCKIVTPVGSKIRVPTHIPIDVSRLDNRLSQFTGPIEMAKAKRARIIKGELVEDLIEKRNRLLILRKTIISVSPKNHVPNIYQRGDYGRACGVSTNLQFISKEDRFILLKGRNLYDYDFALCHPTIFYYLLRNLNGSTNAIKNYLDNRYDVANQIKDRTGLKDDVIKEILNVLVYSDNPRTPFGNIKKLCRNTDRFNKLQNTPVFQELLEEYKHGRQQIVDRYTKGKITTSPTGHYVAEGKQGSRLALVLQSIESEMLEYACSPFDDTVLLCFDGWISPKRDTCKVTDHINKSISERIGMELTMNLKETGI